MIAHVLVFNSFAIHLFQVITYLATACSTSTDNGFVRIPNNAKTKKGHKSFEVERHIFLKHLHAIVEWKVQGTLDENYCDD